MAQDNDLEKLLQRLEEDLEHHMNLKFAELEKRSERIASESNLRRGITTLYLKTKVLGTKGRKSITTVSLLTGVNLNSELQYERMT